MNNQVNASLSYQLYIDNAHSLRRHLCRALYLFSLVDLANGKEPEITRKAHDEQMAEQRQ